MSDRKEGGGGGGGGSLATAGIHKLYHYVCMSLLVYVGAYG